MSFVNYIKRQESVLYCGDKPILLRGFGLGGWLLPEGYMWKLYNKCDRPRRMEELITELCGSEYATSFWEKYFSSYINEYDIALIAAKGFNCVRLPMNARYLYTHLDGKYDWNEQGFSYINRLIKWCRKHNVYIILDMHGAPGGQTGTNIDDSIDDKPELFMNRQCQLDLIALWKEIAGRYVDEPVIAGYDLLNEPLPNWVSEHNHKVVPLYNELIQAIRSVDRNHLIIIEGVHWATDFSIFDVLKKDEIDHNLMLQFHKYWSPPDEESLAYFLDYRDKLNLPLFMGEGGENNLMWYSAVFPLYGRLNISWSFWSYKKMDCSNSPISFMTPTRWNRLIKYIDGKISISREEAIVIFNEFLDNLQKPIVNHAVFNSLECRVPIRIHCEFFNGYSNMTTRQKGADLRCNSPVNIFFENGKLGVPDYKRYNGEPEPQEENLIVEIREGERLKYEFLKEISTDVIQISILARGEGQLAICCEDVKYTWDIKGNWTTLNWQFKSSKAVKEKHELYLLCQSGHLQLDYIDLNGLNKSSY